MDREKIGEIVQRLFVALEKRIPGFLEEPDDMAISQGNAVMLVIDGNGDVHGKYVGPDPVKQVELGQVAWKKAVQVRLTRVSTGRYEELAYSRRLHWWKYGIPLPEFVGWDGGIPGVLSDGTPLAIAFS